ncbi:hypothetical protein B296_00056081 [Ensete ventricosum]|uniref:Uncharacterized protein n=1 Tax=Ensete ventricosum TaxID=4639 RepID=A0A426XWM5_ENSVE|nr:hypothetical protein B296_00056081 [Ensete ventricosum]
MALALTRSFVAPSLPSGFRSPPLRHRTRARGLRYSRKSSLRRRLLPSVTRTCVSATLVSSSASRPQSEPPETLVKPSVLTFQQAIQRLQVCSHPPLRFSLLVRRLNLEDAKRVHMCLIAVTDLPRSNASTI